MYFISGYAGFYCPRYSIVYCWCWTWKDVWEKAWIQGSREPGADSSGRVHEYKVQESQELIAQVEYMNTRFKRARS